MEGGAQDIFAPSRLRALWAQREQEEAARKKKPVEWWEDRDPALELFDAFAASVRRELGRGAAPIEPLLRRAERLVEEQLGREAEKVAAATAAAQQLAEGGADAGSAQPTQAAVAVEAVGGDLDGDIEAPDVGEVADVGAENLEDESLGEALEALGQLGRLKESLEKKFEKPEALAGGALEKNQTSLAEILIEIEDLIEAAYLQKASGG